MSFFLSFFSVLVIILSFISACKQLAKHLPKTPAGKVVKEGFKFTKQTTSLDFVKGRMTKRKHHLQQKDQVSFSVLKVYTKFWRYLPCQ